MLIVAAVVLAPSAANAAPSPDSGPATGGTAVSVPVPGAESFLQVAAGYAHSLALDAEGNVWAWGDDSQGQLGNGDITGDMTVAAQVTTGTAYAAIAAGETHSLALDSDGNLWGWGNNGFGQVGNAAPAVNAISPEQISTGTRYTAIAAGELHSLALDTDGNLWGWGYNGYGQVGSGSAHGDPSTPLRVSTGTRYTAIAAGGYHSLALDADGNLWSWGDDRSGQLGNGAPGTVVRAPAQVSTGTSYNAIAAGSTHSIALDTEGTLWSWGDDGSEQLGNGAATGDVIVPTPVTTGTTYVALAAATGYSITLDSDGNLWTWGTEYAGQLGNGASTSPVNVPTQVSTGTSYGAIAAGSAHSLALDADGSPWTWGSDEYGKLGNGAPGADVTAPAPILTHPTFVAVSAGEYHSVALDSGGNLWTWGYNTAYQLGNGGYRDVSIPAQVTTGTTFTTVAAGGTYSLALDSGGNIWALGFDDAGPFGSGAYPTWDTTRPTQISTGTTYTEIVSNGDHSLAIDSDGNLWSWGTEISGQLGNGGSGFNDVLVPAQITTGTSYTNIAVGLFASLALDADGNLWTWGWSLLGDGSTGVEVVRPEQVTTSTVYTEIAAAEYHAVAIDAQGDLWTWGFEGGGRLGNGNAASTEVTVPTKITTGTPYTAATAGGAHSVALDTAGNLWTWGSDYTGDRLVPTQITTSAEYTSIAAGIVHSMALDTAGALWTWGHDGYGQLGNGAPTDIVMEPTRLGGSTQITGIAFDGTLGTNLTRLGDTVARVTTPAGTPGPATVTIQYSYNGQPKPTLTLPQRFSYLALPDAPTGVTATAGDTRIDLSWTAPASTGGVAITDYLVEYSANNGSTWSVFPHGTVLTTTTVTGLSNGTRYSFRVAAVTSTGTGAASATVTSTPVGVPGPLPGPSIPNALSTTGSAIGPALLLGGLLIAGGLALLLSRRALRKTPAVLGQPRLD